MIRPDLLDDDAWDEPDESLPPKCDACGVDLTDNDHSDVYCDDCTGLARCCDDMCRGSGYCLHDPNAWRP